MRSLASAILFVVMAASVSGQAGQKPKKFLTGPLVIEDQGSFFIGGVQKVTDYAAPPPALPEPPLPPGRLRTRSRSARCTCSSRFRRRSTAAGGR